MGKMAGLAFIAAGLLWSFREGSSFVFNAYFIRGPAPVPVPDPMLDRNNIILTRYAFNSFPFAPPYASHGYVDPYLENRVLAPDLKKELSSNVVAAEPADAASAIALASTYDGDRTTVLAPALTLAPGVRYAVRFTPTAVPPAGSLLLLGKFVTRQYYLPDSAMGMAHHLPGNAFGFTPTSRDFFPLWTVQTQPEIVGIRYVYEARPAAAIPATFAHVYLQPYSVNSLPIRISSWMPYRAKTSSASAGAWLETPRMYIPGYAATVNGRRARISSSPSGLVAVSLQAGQNDVVLRYPGPWLLRASYWTALATWAAVIAAIVLGARRRWLRAVAASDGA